MAVVLFVGARVVPGSIVLLMLSVSVILGALMQWIATAKSRRDAARRAVKAVTVVAAVYMFWDCGWIWEWICIAI